MRYSSSLYPEIARCQHIKINGVQCGSPALLNRKFCFFHTEGWQSVSPFSETGQASSCGNLSLQLRISKNPWPNVE